MTTLTLKSYQQAALSALRAFARSAQLKGAALAFGEAAGRPYNADPFGQVPCICLRIPTGGGKTLMATHAVNVLAREWRATDAPVVVWLVPSDTIRSQTLKALQTAGHPYREALEASYGSGVRVCVLEDLANIAPPDWGKRAVVVVATIQSFRIDALDKRNVYSFSESFERHFRACDEHRLRVLHGLPDALVTADEAKNDKTGVLTGFINQPRWSLANWLAHVYEAKFSTAAHELADRLINSMGFEALDVASMVVQQSSLPLFDLFNVSNEPLAPMNIALVATNFIAARVSDELRQAAGVEVTHIAGEQNLVVTGHINLEMEALLVAQVAQHNALAAAQAAPASRGERFAPVPTLGYRSTPQGQLWPLEREAVLEAVELDLLSVDAIALPGFQVVEQSNTFEIYLKDAKINLRAADASQIAFDYGSTTITAQDLVRWLDQSLFQKLPDLTQGQRSSYFAAVVGHLMHERGVPLVTLAKARFKLAQDIKARVGDLKDKAAKAQFRQLVLEGEWTIEPDWTRPLLFETNRYPVPAGSRYAGRYQFNKHFYPVLADLKDGGEEFVCAQLLDNHAKVKHWVRNRVTEPCGFALATSRGRFFPDFVAEPRDGRVAVVEYKGAHLLNEPYEIEKRQIGELWASKSGGKCVFGQIARDKNGVGVAGQLDALLA